MQRFARAIGATVVTALVAGGMTWASSVALGAAAAAPPGAGTVAGRAESLPTVTLPTLPTVTLPTLPTVTLPTLPTSTPTSAPPTSATATTTASATATGTATPGTDVLELLGGLGLPASAEVGQLITLTDPVWSLPGVTTTYQWLRDGAPIPGANGPTYVPGLDDAGHAIAAQVTGSLVGIPGITVITDALDIPLLSGAQLTPTGDVAIGGTRKVGTTLTLTGPTWDQADATNSYQWLRDDAPIAGATTATYPLVADDLGHAISVKVTGHKDGFTDNTITGDPVQPVIGDAIQFVMKPRVTGTGRVGRLLTADPGQWTGGVEGSGAPTFTYQWLRAGRAIAGAVAQSYQVEEADAGTDLAVLVTATRPAYRAGRFTTAPVHVAKLASKLSASLAKMTVSRGKAVTMTLVLKVPGLRSPTGAVKILDGSKVLQKSSFAKGRHGRVVVRLTKLTPGVHRLKAVYAGSSTVAGATSKVLKLTVRR